MRKYILLLLLCLFSGTVLSQVSLSYSAGYGTNDLEDLRDVMKYKLDIINRIAPGSVITDDFASPIIHTLEVSYLYQAEEFGVQISILNTTGTITHPETSMWKDSPEKYSLKGLRLGTLYRHPLAEVQLTSKYKLLILGELSPGVTISSLKYTGAVPLNNGLDITDASTSKVSISILPMAAARLHFTEKFGVQAAAGYDFSFGGKLDDAYRTKINWSGLRARLGVFYVL